MADLITYERLYEILRNEKFNNELQELDENFFKNTLNYIKQKRAILESQKQKKSSIFGSSETEKTEKMLNNAQKILTEIYERRENKIVQLALFASRSNEEIDLNSLLPEEKRFYDSIIPTLDKFRKNILHRLLSEEMPETPEESKELEKKGDLKTIRFLQAIPKFVGDDMKVYGPFEEEDISNLPPKVAQVLIQNERAKEINIQ